MSVLFSIIVFFFSASHPNVQYVADFAPELGMIIMETKYLEQLGFQVPELARNVALQVNYHARTNVVSHHSIFASKQISTAWKQVNLLFSYFKRFLVWVLYYCPSLSSSCFLQLWLSFLT